MRALIAFEQVLCTVLILTTGAWSSPFALCLVPAGMLAGFAAGWLFSSELAACAVATITLQDVIVNDAHTALQHAAVWTALLGMVAFTSGLAHRSALDSARQQRLAQDRVSMLAEANSLLFALQRVAQTLPASLDLDEVLDSTVSRVDGLMDSDIVVVMLFDRSGVATAIRMRGLEQLAEFPFDELPAALRDAVGAPRPVRRERVAAGEGLSDRSASGLYAALRARGALVGLLAIESERPSAFDQRQVELVHGLTEPFGIAIDNARMFRQIRTMAADEERSRIARDLHDHIGSSLATIGFEVDRAVAISHDPAKVEPVLRELRAQVSVVVSEVRETLYDLRTELSEDKDLGRLLDDYLPRVQLRSGIDLHAPGDDRGTAATDDRTRGVADHARGDHQRGAPLACPAPPCGRPRDRRPHHRCGARRWCRDRRHADPARLIRNGRDAGTSGEHRCDAHRQAPRIRRDGDQSGHADGRGDRAVGLTVMLVDDHTMLRQGLRRALEGEGITVIAEAGDGATAVKLALETHPDVVLMDVSMPTVDGVEATKRLMGADARQRVVMLTMHADRDVIDRSIKAGAVGYLTKDSSIAEVIMAIKLAANGDRPMSPRLATAMLDEAKKMEEGVVSAREEEVLQLVADGLGTTEIAERMYISQKTVKNHLASIYEKLNARDRTQAVLTAVRMGIVKLS